MMGMGINTILAAGKFSAGVMGHSQALIADSVESMADIFSSVIVWRGLVVASTPADDDHPYGHGKAEPLASAIVAFMLLLAAVTLPNVRALLHGQKVTQASRMVQHGKQRKILLDSYWFVFFILFY